MNLPINHLITDAELVQVNNPLGEAGDPVMPFAWQQPTVTSHKIQVEDQRLNPAGNPVGEKVKQAVFMPQYGMSNTTLSKPFFALKHVYEFYQHICNMPFLNPKKRCKLFGNTLTGTAASHWDQVTQDHIQVAAFVATLAYFKMWLQEWVRLYYGKEVCQRHFTFMHTKGAIVKDKCLHVDEYAFWEAIYLLNEMGDFLPPEPLVPAAKLTEAEKKRFFFRDSPRPGSLVAPSGFPDIGISVRNYGPERNSGGIDQISEKFRFSGILVFERQFRTGIPLYNSGIPEFLINTVVLVLVLY